MHGTDFPIHVESILFDVALFESTETSRRYGGPNGEVTITRDADGSWSYTITEYFGHDDSRVLMHEFDFASADDAAHDAGVM